MQQTMVSFADPSEIEFKQYSRRWGMLALFCLLTAANAVSWICYSSISSIAETYYGVDTTLINLLSVLFLALYLPGSIAATYAYARYNTKTGLLIGAALTAAGCWIRTIGTINVYTSTAWRYSWAMAGQILCALGQPFFTNAPAKIASEWFAVDQRAVATTIGAMFNPIGIAIGQVFPPIVVDPDTSGMSIMLIIAAAFATVVMLLTAVFFQERPPTPPSRSTHSKNMQKADFLIPGAAVFDERFFLEVKACLMDKNFRVLIFSFGMGLGAFNALSTLIEQFVKPCGYSSDEAGYFGGLIIGFGLLGAGIVGPVLDATHKYNLFLRGGFVACAGACIAFLFALRPDQPIVVGVAFALLGLCMLPLLPIAMECAAECTYPMNEEVSSGILMFAGNLFGVGLIFLLGYLIDLRSEYKDVYTPAGLTLLGLVVVIVVVVQLYNGPYKRLEAERTHHSAGDGNLLDTPHDQHHEETHDFSPAEELRQAGDL